MVIPAEGDVTCVTGITASGPAGLVTGGPVTLTLGGPGQVRIVSASAVGQDVLRTGFANPPASAATVAVTCEDDALIAGEECSLGAAPGCAAEAAPPTPPGLGGFAAPPGECVIYLTVTLTSAGVPGVVTQTLDFPPIGTFPGARLTVAPAGGPLVAQMAVAPIAPAPPPPTDLAAASAVQFVSGRYVSGSRQLQVGDTTRVELSFSVRNAFPEPLDYTRTVVLDLGQEAVGQSILVSAGDATITGGQVVWGGFTLDPDEEAELTVVLDVMPVVATVGRTVVIITRTRTTAAQSSGGFVDVTGQPVTSAAVMGLLTGGFMIAAAPSAAAPAAPAVAPVLSTPVAPATPPRPATMTPPVMILPRSGTGLAAGDASDARELLLGLALIAGIGALPLAARLQRRHHGG